LGDHLAGIAPHKAHETNKPTLSGKIVSAVPVIEVNIDELTSVPDIDKERSELMERIRTMNLIGRYTQEGNHIMIKRYENNEPISQGDN
jgi:hypothetical protein